MANKISSLAVVCALSSLILSGCGQEDINNERLAKGCAAAVETILAKDIYDRQFDRVVNKKFSMSDGFKLVTLDVVTKTKEYEEEANETFNCKFEEGSSFGGFAWYANLVQLTVDEDVYGTRGGEISGSLNDQMALSDAVEKAMK
ncbi:MAG: hypothetical protein AUJ12_04240 [Alphaproteobacteria bacterium CG1_02_46_17]|nr:MAG: hypothetical protein AUJ12_04240 [Alphaproteobacteria bacterium CG1_02_46_17]